MNLYQAGNLAKSLAGHDKGQIFVIIKEEEEYVDLADGNRRKLENPKRKKKKHIQPIYCRNNPEQSAESNEKIKRTIRLFLNGYEV